MSEYYNSVAKKVLNQLGYSCEPEPNWISRGRKPDFFCHGKEPIWVEVKSIDWPEEFSYPDMILDRLREATSDIKNIGHYRGSLWVAADANDNDVKFVKNAVEKWLTPKRFEANEEAIIISQRDPVPNKIVTFDYDVKGKRLFVFSQATLSDELSIPTRYEPNDLEQSLTLKYTDGTSDQKPFRAAVRGHDSYRLALGAEPHHAEFRIVSAARAEGAAFLGDAETIRRITTDANRQFKSAWRFREAPSLLIIFHDNIFAAPGETVRAALLGDLTARLSQMPEPELLDLYFGKNGAFRRDKNTTTSAVCYFPNAGVPIVVQHPDAKRRLPEHVLKKIQMFNGQGKANCALPMQLRFLVLRAYVRTLEFWRFVLLPAVRATIRKPKLVS